MTSESTLLCRTLRDALDRNYRDQTESQRSSSTARNRLIVLKGELQILRQEKEIAQQALQFIGPVGRVTRTGEAVRDALAAAVGMSKISELDMLIERMENDITQQELVVYDAEEKERYFERRISQTQSQMRDANCDGGF